MFNLPMAVTVQEMICDFQCAEAIWEAKNEKEFQSLIAQGHGRRTTSIWGAHQAVLATKWTGIDRFPLENLKISDMNIIITGKFWLNIL